MIKKGTKVLVKDEAYDIIGHGVVTGIKTHTINYASLSLGFQRRIGVGPKKPKRKVEKDVVITLDDGSTLYGCQCWWQKEN